MSIADMIRDDEATAEINRIAMDYGVGDSRASLRDRHRLGAGAGAAVRGWRLERAGLASIGELGDGIAQLSGAEKGELLELTLSADAEGFGLTGPEYRDQLIELSGGNRDDESLAWAALVRSALAQVGSRGPVVNLEGELVELAAQKYGEADAPFADPGYREGVKRYPLTTEKRVRSAWSYINQAGNAKFYTSAQLDRVKAKIRAAMRKLGIDIGPEEHHQGDRKHHDSHRRRRGQEGLNGPRQGIDGSDSMGSGMDTGGPDGGGGAAMSAVPGYFNDKFVKLAQEAEDGDPSAIYAARQAGESAFGSGHAQGPDFEVREVSRDDTEQVDVDAYLARLKKDKSNRSVFGEQTPVSNGNGSVSPKGIAARNRGMQQQNSRPENAITR